MGQRSGLDSVYYRGINPNCLHVWIKLDNPNSLWGLRTLHCCRSAHPYSARLDRLSTIDKHRRLGRVHLWKSLETIPRNSDWTKESMK